MFRSALLASFGFALMTFTSCANTKAKAQEEAVNCDVLFEYQAVENDSISLMVGNTIRLHTDKATPGSFYPLMISVRSPEDLDKPTSTEFIANEQALHGFLAKHFPLLKSIGVVMGGSALQKANFSEQNALIPLRSLSKQIPDSHLQLFYEKGGEIVSSRGLD